MMKEMPLGRNSLADLGLSLKVTTSKQLNIGTDHRIQRAEAFGSWSIGTQERYLELLGHHREFREAH
jgi:hypothetical protein